MSKHLPQWLLISRKWTLIDAPRQEFNTTALVVNVDQAQTEIVALNAAPLVAEPVTAVEATVPETVAEPTQAVAAVEVTQLLQKKQLHLREVQAQPTAPAKRASNDPRQRRRQQREAQAQQAAAPKLTPSQAPTLAQYSIGSLIRHVYGSDVRPD